MKQFFSKFSRTTWIVIGVLVAAGLAAFIYNSTRGETVSTFQTVKAERGNLVATVGATGSVRARQSAVLVWQTTGIVNAVNVDIGSRVTRDDVMAA